METPQVEQRIDDLISQMTREEKSQMCHASGAFTSGGCERLGIPPLTMSDGPHGVRHEMDNQTWQVIGGDQMRGTYLPTGTAMAATWNPQLAYDFGRVLGAEARHRGKDVILGPGVNIIRTPLCGRNFEYYSEDPHLAAELVVPCVRGIQENDVAACVKHYALNNQELDRMSADVQVDERALWEIYLPAFEAGARAGAWTFMGAYNKYRGQHCCHNERLVDDVLKGAWGWDGAFMSDWGGVHDTLEAARFGLDIEMGSPTPLERNYLAQPLVEAVRGGKVDESLVDEKIRRILRLMFRVGLLGDRPRQGGRRNTSEHQQTALAIARESIVLLKNDAGLLPLRRDGLRRVVVIGENAIARQAHGGGSSMVPALYEVTPLEGLRKMLGDGVELVHVMGYPRQKFAHKPIPTDVLGIADQSGIRAWRAEYFDNRRFHGEPRILRPETDVDLSWQASSAPGGIPADKFSIRWTATITPRVSGQHEFAIFGVDCCQLHVDDVLYINLWGNEAPEVRTSGMKLVAGRQYRVRVHLNPKQDHGQMQLGWLTPEDDLSANLDDLGDVVPAADDADAVIYVGGLSHRQESEGADRTSLALPGGQDPLIEELLRRRPDMVVVMVGGSPMAMPWIDKVRAVVWMGYNGMECGTALAEVLLGAVNPSGKLPMTFPAALEDSPAHALDAYHPHRVEYSEGLFVGYRWFEAKGIKPLLPFGHGLSYTAFEYADLAVEQPGDGAAVRVSATLRNTGEVAGSEVVQLYVGDTKCSQPRPIKELKAFSKVKLSPGQSRRVAFDLSLKDLSFYDPAVCDWRCEDGEFTVHVGSSSSDIRLRGSFLRQPCA